MVLAIVPISIKGQVSVHNQQSDKILIAAAGNSKIINPGTSAFISWLPANGTATFMLSYYNSSMVKTDIGNVSRPIENGKIIINSYDQTIVPVRSGPDTDNLTTVNHQLIPQEDCWSTVEVQVKNASSYRWIALGAPFNGLSLKAGQSSPSKIKVCTKEYIFAVKFNQESDDSSSGREYSFAVIDKIVAEGDEKIEITDHDLLAEAEKSTKKIIRNNFSKDFLVMNGPNKGRVIGANSPTKLKLDIGWNVLCLQYKNVRDQPVQATLLVLCNETPRPMVIMEKKSVRSSENPDGISFDNWTPPKK